MNILVVDDHPMIVEAYIKSIGTMFDLLPVSFSIASDCKQAYNFANCKPAGYFDIAVIDYRLPPYSEKNILSGCDVALQIKKNMPDCKIIFITGHTEVITIYDIYKKILPEALIIKNDITMSDLIDIVGQAITGKYYVSPSAQKCIKDIWQKDSMIEEYNRQILYYLVRGYKVKDLGKVVYLAQSTIQRRVISMKRAFNVSDDNGLVREAIQQGFI